MKRQMTWILIALALAAPGMAAAEDRRERSSRDWDARGLTRIEIERRGAAELARDTRLTAELRPGALQIRVEYPQRREIRLDVWDLMKGIEIPEVDVDLALQVPPLLQVMLRSSSGDMRTSQLTGRQQVRTASGDVEVADAPGNVAIETRR